MRRLVAFGFLLEVASRLLVRAHECSATQGDVMPKIPAPRKSDDDCIRFAGLTVCPHTVYLTKTQKKAVDRMHLQNVSKIKRLKSVAARKSAKGNEGPKADRRNA